MPATAKPLTNTEIKNAKPKDTQYKMSDGGSMYLLVKPNGSKLWQMDYRLHDKRLTASFGSYPEVSLASAREQRTEARRLVAEGIHPGQHKAAVKKAARAVAANTFEAVAWEWFELHIKPKSLVYQERTRGYLERDLIPYLGRLPIASIEPPALLECLRRVENRKNNRGNTPTETVNRIRAEMSQLWRYAIVTGRAKNDIAHSLRGALKRHVGTNYSHLTDPALLGKLVRDIKDYGGSPVVKAALRLMPLLFARPGELRNARWSEIDFDAKQWRYVATKTNADHIVPLSDQAVKILRELQPVTGTSELVFKGRGEGTIAPNAVNQALKYLGYGNDVIQPHGFRHTAATMLADRLGFPEHEIERQLSHKVAGVKGVYQKAQYLESRTKMMQAWADYLDQISA